MLMLTHALLPNAKVTTFTQPPEVVAKSQMDGTLSEMPSRHQASRNSGNDAAVVVVVVRV